MTDNIGAYWVDWTTKKGVSKSDSFDSEPAAAAKFKGVVRAGATKAQAYYMPGDDNREPYIIAEYPEPPDEDE